jgi:23S rRNA pseudouridine1911/1915/1917 synthase
MNEKYEVVVEEHHQDLRLDKFLSLTTPLSRTRIQDLLKNQAISVTPEKIFDAHAKVKLGETYRIIVPVSIEADPIPQDIPLDILYEDDQLLVINKPTDFVVHPAPGHGDGTLVNALLHHCGDSLSGIGGVKRPGIIHRLDKDTSGIMIVAKTDAAHQGLSLQFHDREICLKKIYWALVWGRPYPTSGMIDAPIGRHLKDRQKMAINLRGKSAQTSYKVLKVFNCQKDPQIQISLVECQLHTGRTHQIRVHLQHLGMPIIGDTVYGKTRIKQGLWPDAIYNFPRQALHAYSLDFLHPTTGEQLTFQAPLAKDMGELLQTLQLP